MSSSKISRRGFLQTAAVGAGALAGTRLAGSSLLGEAKAAGETSHLVHIVFPGGYNALFSGCGQILNGKFGVTGTNIKPVTAGSPVFTDAATLGTLPAAGLDHFAAVGVHHGVTSHLDRGAERALLFDGTNSYLQMLAVAMGGTSPLKSVHFGDRLPYGPQPAYQGVSLQHITDLSTAIKTLGAGTPDPSTPDRTLAAGGLTSSQNMSKVQTVGNERALTTVNDGYTSAVAALSAPPPPPVTFADISTAYGLGGATAVNSFAAMMAGAEVMIRAANTNVINICDLGFVLWDFHQLDGGGNSLNGTFSRSKMTRSIVAPLKTFITRMLSLTDRNVVVALSGDFVRLPSGDHGDGTMVTMMGKYVKPVLSFPSNASCQFSGSTPGSKGFWAAAAAALKVPGTPFGANPHTTLV